MERSDLQQFLKRQIDIIAPNTLVIAEEFSQFEDTRRRIDLLGVDKDANLVVVELKRTKDGGRMELQAIRYAAMVSNMTFEQALDVYKQYIEDEKLDEDAEESLLDFLDWEAPKDDEFNQNVKIILASEEFSKELTASVLWLNERELDINCFRMQPYKLNDELLLDVQKIIPLPETEDFQVKIRQKQQQERKSRLVLRFAGKRIYKLIANNPRRKGTHGWRSWELIENGMTFEEYKSRGGRSQDLRWDIDRGRCEVK